MITAKGLSNQKKYSVILNKKLHWNYKIGLTGGSVRKVMASLSCCRLSVFWSSSSVARCTDAWRDSVPSTDDWPFCTTALRLNGHNDISFVFVRKCLFNAGGGTSRTGVVRFRSQAYRVGGRGRRRRAVLLAPTPTAASALLTLSPTPPLSPLPLRPLTPPPPPPQFQCNPLHSQRV